MSSPLIVRLTRFQRKFLKRQRRRARSNRARDRITAMLLLAAGVPMLKILESLSITRTTLLRWKHRWLKRRLFGFEDAERSGRPPKATSRYVQAMLRLVPRDPREFGYVFTRWTAPRLAQYLGETTGIWLTPAWVSELLRQHGIVWRKTKRTIRNLQNRAAKKRAQKALRRLKKGLCDPEPITNSGSPTGSGSTCFPSRSTPTASGVNRFGYRRRARTPVWQSVEP